MVRSKNGSLYVSREQNIIWMSSKTDNVTVRDIRGMALKLTGYKIGPFYRLEFISDFLSIVNDDYDIDLLDNQSTWNFSEGNYSWTIIWYILAQAKYSKCKPFV